MAPGSAAKPAARKRNRKRKRRNVSSSSSSSSSSDSESSSGAKSESAPATTAKLRVHGKRTVVKVVSAAGEDASDEDSSEAESSAGDSDVEMASAAQPAPAASHLAPATNVEPSAAPVKTVKMRQRYESPPPMKDVPPPTMLPTNDAQKEQVLKDRFRKFWMSNIADAFADDLNTIRNEPNLTQSRLTLLIDSLASGADVYSSSCGPSGKRTNEVEVILGDS